MSKPYVSEFTAFIDRLLAEHPEIERDQRIGRAMYWDREVDLSRERQMASAAVPMRGYVYFDNPSPDQRGRAHPLRGPELE